MSQPTGGVNPAVAAVTACVASVNRAGEGHSSLVAPRAQGQLLATNSHDAAGPGKPWCRVSD